MIKEISEKKERLKTFMKQKGFKSTRQRDLIASEFFKCEDHITADDLYRIINKRHKEIGSTTVYRTLKLLEESGLATARVFADVAAPQCGARFLFQSNGVHRPCGCPGSPC